MRRLGIALMCSMRSECTRATLYEYALCAGLRGHDRGSCQIPMGAASLTCRLQLLFSGVPMLNGPNYRTRSRAGGFDDGGRNARRARCLETSVSTKCAHTHGGRICTKSAALWTPTSLSSLRSSLGLLRKSLIPYAVKWRCSLSVLLSIMAGHPPPGRRHNCVVWR